MDTVNDDSSRRRRGRHDDDDDRNNNTKKPARVVVHQNDHELWQCAICQQFKAQENYYSKTQQGQKATRSTRQCKACRDIAGKEDTPDNAEHERRRHRRELYDTEGIQEALSIHRRTNGCVPYDFSNFLDNLPVRWDAIDHDWMSQPEGETPQRDDGDKVKNRPSATTDVHVVSLADPSSLTLLCGTHDIIFHVVHCTEPDSSRSTKRHERTSRGTLTILPVTTQRSDNDSSGTDERKEGDEPEADPKCFQGTVEIDATTRADSHGIEMTTFDISYSFLGHWSSTGSIVTLRQGCELPSPGELNNRPFEMDESDWEEEDELSGDFLVFTKRVTLPLLLHEHEPTGESYTVEQVEALVKRPDYSQSWMCGEKAPVPLQPSIVELIHEYMNRRLEPSFAFEPGDLWLRTRKVSIIARKRTPESL